MATTEKSGILFSHYVLRLPAGSTADPWFFLMSQGERAVLQSLMSQYRAAAYLSGHYHQPFQMEDHVSHAAVFGGPSLAQKAAYALVTSDNGILSTNIQYLGDWPAIVITSPQRWYPDGGTKTISGTVPIRVKVFGDASVTSVKYGINAAPAQPMTSLGNNIWEVMWDTTKVAAGVQRIYVIAADSRDRSKQAMIEVKVSPP